MVKKSENLKNNKSKKNYFNTKTMIFLLFFTSALFFHAENSDALTVDFYDNWGYGETTCQDDGYVGCIGSGYDKISFIEDSCLISGFSSDTQWMIMGVYDNVYPVLAYCLNTDRNADSDYDICIAKNSTVNCDVTNVMPAPYIDVDTYTSSTWFYADQVNLYTDTPICDGEAGNTMVDSVKHLKRASVSYYCSSPSNSTCHPCGTSSNDATGDYYYIDQTRAICPSDGSSDFDIEGRYATSSYVYVDSILCSAYGTGKICDTDHQGAISTDKNALPTNPCKLADGYACSSSADCWHNHGCSGAKTEYDGYCSGTSVKLETIPYTNGCGDISILGTITEATKSCVTDGGFPSGWKCDPAYEYILRSSTSAVYNDICRAGEGVSCTSTSDCFTGLECLSGFCAYNALAIYTTNDTDNKLYKNGVVTFDPQLSLSSDSNIQYSCWNYNGVNDKCYGNSSQCSTECSGASFSGANWQTVYSKTFSSGGNFPIKLTVGSKNKYSDDYSESFCVSGDGTYCWSCSDGLRNDDETDIDWGGRCGTPYGLKCVNLIKDNVTGETGIDYGGACGNCTGNATLETDADYLFLKGSGLITSYPFNSSQCPIAQQIQGATVSFVLIIAGILIIPVLVLILIIIGLIVFFGGNLGFLFGGTIYERFFGKKDKKSRENVKK